MEVWLDPLYQIDPNGVALDELMRYVHRKLDMSFEYPRESRLFANEILQGAPRMTPHLETGLKALVDRTADMIQAWMDAGKLAPAEPRHLLFSIWATTQHYADFDAQVQVLTGEEDIQAGARAYIDALFRRLLTP